MQRKSKTESGIIGFHIFHFGMWNWNCSELRRALKKKPHHHDRWTLIHFEPFLLRSKVTTRSPRPISSFLRRPQQISFIRKHFETMCWLLIDMAACVVGGVASAFGCSSNKKDGTPIVKSCSGYECSYNPSSQAMTERNESSPEFKAPSSTSSEKDTN